MVDLEDLVHSSTRTLTFLEIVLRDDEGYPVGGAAFEVLLADGRTWAGQLDAAGFARIDDIERGHCVVRFPELGAA